MVTKSKRPLKKKEWARPTLSLPTWIIFWSLVLCTMIMIVAAFTSAVRPFVEPAYDPAADIAQIKAELDDTTTALQAVE